MVTFALTPKPSDYSEVQLFEELARLPESFSWPNPELIVLRLCPHARRLAQRINWPLLWQCWSIQHGVKPGSDVRIDRIEDFQCR